MNNLRSITFRVFSQSLLFTVLAFFSFPAIAQQSKKIALPKQFEKPTWLNCDVKNADGSKDTIREKILYEYGAVYLSRAFSSQKEKIPCWFLNEAEVGKYIDTFKNSANEPAFGKFYLQPQAKAPLLKVFKEMSDGANAYEYVARNCNAEGAQSKAENCTNNINNDWALRTFSDTVYNWFSYRKKKPIDEDWDKWFSSHKDSLTSDDWKEIEDNVKNPEPAEPKMFKNAIPGGSQHHLGLAIDVNNGSSGRVCGDACVKSLENHGWFRTIRYDRFHYTYLGYPEEKLGSIGLKEVQCRDTFTYWVPNVFIKDKQNRLIPYKGFRNSECKDVK
jgi:hypothetical protein